MLILALFLSACGNIDSTLDVELPSETAIASSPDIETPAEPGPQQDPPESEPDSVPVPAPSPAPENEPATPNPENEPEPVPETPEPLPEPAPEPEPEPTPVPVDPNTVFQPDNSDLADRASIYQQDGYDTADVVRLDIRTATQAGVCNVDDLSGCTLADVIADTNPNDDFKVDIAIHFATDQYPDDGLVSNAELRQRGGGTRAAEQKSFRIKLDDSDRLWRTERHLQLNKHPFDSSRIRNKLSFDLMSEIPHLFSFRTQFANLWVDDGQGSEDYGLFTHVERGDERYLERRGLEEGGNLYKANFFRFQESDLRTLLIDSDGEPLNDAIFETVLEVESGDDHRNLIAMLEALHNPQRSFQSVLDQYFNKNNVLTWLTVNLLLGQYDAIRHNYFLFNPVGSEKFYFVPWDYDTSFNNYIEPGNNFSNEALRARLNYGYAIASSNVFIANYYRLPGTHDRILRAADEIRSNYLTNENIAEKANRYASAIASFATREPDSTYNEFFSSQPGTGLADKVESNHGALRNRFSYPLPPSLEVPQLSNGEWLFKWQPAHDLTGNSISYDLLIASSPDFPADSIVFTQEGIADQETEVSQSVDAARLSAGTYYARLVARVSSEPSRFWQVADNRLEIDGVRYYGLVEFESP